jgi:hypothetical protein
MVNSSNELDFERESLVPDRESDFDSELASILQSQSERKSQHSNESILDPTVGRSNLSELWSKMMSENESMTTRATRSANTAISRLGSVLGVVTINPYESDNNTSASSLTSQSHA